ncbi:hypothetical protein ACN47A_24695 [Myxococcus fulvus]|uniref:hypothetical protein n=1 Tax=Myxococcus fulvus TaxID=33 RepID=UPI003B9AC2C1
MMSGAGIQTFIRVRLRNRDNQDVDLSNLLGFDWILDATWTQALDAPVGTATVTLRRHGNGISISPMAVDSPVNAPSPLLYDPLLREGRTIRIDVMTVPLSTGPYATWREAFYGRVDDVELPEDGETIVLACRDWTGHLQDVNLKQEHTFGGGVGGTAVQTVMHNILGSEGLWDFGPYCPVDPLWQLGPFKQATMPLMDALQDLAGQLGWDLRLRWRDDTHGYAFTLAEPERGTTTPVWVFGDESYSDMSVTRRLGDIRNSVRVVYADSNDRDAGGNGKRKTVVVSNSASIVTYGERWAEIVEASTSNINTEVEAQRLAWAFIQDLSEAALEISVTTPLWWHLELGDYVEIRPDGINLDRPERLAVESIEHTVSADKGAGTKLTLRGRPSTSRVQWLKREAIPGVGKSAAFLGPNAPAQLVVSNTVNGASVAFKASAVGPAWDAFELHVSPSPGFTPSDATFRASASTTRFDVTDLKPGVPYYAKLRGRDVKGNVGPASSEVALAPRFITPVDLQPYVNLSALPPNGDFEAHSDTAGPPDTWLMDVGTWGTDASVVSDALTGARAVRLATGGTGIRSQLMAVREGNRYGVDLYAKASTTSTVFTVSIRWLDAEQAYFGETTVIQTAPPVGTYARLSGSAAAPLGTRYARVVITLQNPGSPRQLTVDSVIFAPLSLVAERPTLVTGQMFAAGGGGWTNFGSPEHVATYTKGLDEEVVLEGAIRGGTIGGVAFNVPAGYRPSANIRCVTAAANGFARIRVEPTGAVVVESAPDSTRVNLDGVRFVFRG